MTTETQLPADRRKYYRTATALVACAAFAAGEIVGVSFYHYDAKGQAWFLIERTAKRGYLGEQNAVAYPEKHLSNFVL